MIDDILRNAYDYASEHSDDPRTQNGAVLVCDSGDSFYGANSFPSRVFITDERTKPENKLNYMIHAEEDAISNAAFFGVSTKDSTLYCPWAACAKCAQLIINAGVKKVVVHKQIMDKTPIEWADSIQIAKTMFKESGVEFIEFDSKIGRTTNLFRGEVWEP